MCRPLHNAYPPFLLPLVTRWNALKTTRRSSPRHLLGNRRSIAALREASSPSLLLDPALPDDARPLCNLGLKLGPELRRCVQCEHVAVGLDAFLHLARSHDARDFR